MVQAGEIAQLPIMVDDGALVRGDHMLAAPQRRDQMIEGDLAGSDPQRGDLDDRVRSRPTNVLGRALRNPATARFQRDAGIREPQRPPHVDPARVLHRPVPRGQDRDDGGIESELSRQFGPMLQEESSKFPPHVAEPHEDDPMTHPIRLQMSNASPMPCRVAAVTTSSATAASCTPTPVRSATMISCADVRPRLSPAAISPSSAYTPAGRRPPASTAWLISPNPTTRSGVRTPRRAASWYRAWVPTPTIPTRWTSRFASRSAARAPAAPVRRSVRYPLSNKTARGNPVIESNTKTMPLPTERPRSGLAYDPDATLIVKNREPRRCAPLTCASAPEFGMSRWMTPGRIASPRASRTNASRTTGRASAGPTRSRISFSERRRRSITPSLSRPGSPAEGRRSAPGLA